MEAENGKNRKAEVIITHGRTIEEGIDLALDHIRDFSWLVRGRHVAVKPNDTWASREDTSAVTRPDTLRAVLRYLKKFNPGTITVTGGSGAHRDGKPEDSGL